MTKVKSYVPAAIRANTKGTADGVIVTAVRVTNQAKSNAQFAKGYQTGQTRGGLMWKTKDDDGGRSEGAALETEPKGIGAVVGVNNDHAVYVEMGTRYMEAQPFLRPAVDQVTNGTSAAEAMARAIRDSVKRGI